MQPTRPAAATLLIFALWFTTLFGCASPARRGHVLWQNGTIDALLDGNYDGETTIAQLRHHGDTGLGTFNALDGEMVMLDGDVFQVRSDGRVSKMCDAERTPFAAVFYGRKYIASTDIVDLHHFTGPLTLAQLQQKLDALRTGDGHAAAVRVYGKFASVRTRSVPAQTLPYRRLADVVPEQSVFNLTDISGTMVGLWFPASLSHVNVPGYHFHFLTEDRTAGGHVLDLVVLDATVMIQSLSTVEIEIPVKPPTTRPSADREAELRAVETNNK